MFSGVVRSLFIVRVLRWPMFKSILRKSKEIFSICRYERQSAICRKILKHYKSLKANGVKCWYLLIFYVCFLTVGCLFICNYVHVFVPQLACWMYKELGMAKVNLLGSVINNNTTKHVLISYSGMAFICQDNICTLKPSTISTDLSNDRNVLWAANHACNCDIFMFRCNDWRSLQSVPACLSGLLVLQPLWYTPTKKLTVS